MTDRSDAFSAFRGKKVLVTGGLGFIGSNLSRHLVELGALVTSVDNMDPSCGGNLFNVAGIEDKMKIEFADVRDEHSIYRLVQDQDYLFNLAGHTSHIDSMTNPLSDLRINCEAQLSILEACRKRNPAIKIVFASTRQVYGTPKYLPVDEAHPLKPVDVNGINKLAGESYHTLYCHVYGIRACSLRMTNTFGPRMGIRDTRHTFLGVWIRLLLEGHPFEVWGGQQLRDFNYIDDCIEALELAAAHENTCGQVFNLGDSQVISLQELADLLVDINGGGKYEVRPFPEDPRKIDIGDYYSEYARFAEAVGWKPRVGLREGLAKTIDYFRANLNHYV
jgi:UDP-glucose 4-epimerase